MSPGWSGGSIPGQDINPELLSMHPSDYECVWIESTYMGKCLCEKVWLCEGSIRMSPSVMCPVQLLLNYQRWRRESPEISSCLSPSSVLGLLNTSYHAVLPQRDFTGSRVLIYRIGQYAWVWMDYWKGLLGAAPTTSTRATISRQSLPGLFPQWFNSF